MTDPEQIVVDTNIVSFYFSLHTTAGLYTRHLSGKIPAISMMVVGEVLEGAFLDGWGERRMAELERTLAEYHIVDLDEEVVRLWAKVRAERSEQPISARDAFHAATALKLGCPLLTHNPSDFEGITGLVVITEAPPTKKGRRRRSTGD